MTKDKIHPQDLDDEKDDEEGGSSSSTTTGGSTGIDFTSWIPGFNDFLQAPEDQQNLRDFNAQINQENRLEAKKHGIDVQALNKKQQLRQDPGNYIHDGINNRSSPGGSGFDEHPELAFMDGMIDPSVVLPSSEQEIRNNPELKNSLKMGLSMQAALELKNKQRYRNEPEQPRYRPRSAPKPRPF